MKIVVGVLLGADYDVKWGHLLLVDVIVSISISNDPPVVFQHVNRNISLLSQSVRYIDTSPTSLTHSSNIGSQI